MGYVVGFGFTVVILAIVLGVRFVLDELGI